MNGQTSRLLARWHMGKAQFPEAVVLVRCGDFLEAFHDDAPLVAKVLDVALTKRTFDGLAVPMCGFPFHATVDYLQRLNEAGHDVYLMGSPR